jgi:hypothetical protein
MAIVDSSPRNRGEAGRGAKGFDCARYRANVRASADCTTMVALGAP